MAHDAAVTEDGNYLVTADEMQGGNLKLWDIRDYSNINLLDEFTVNPTHSVHNVYIKDGLVYTSYYADGTRVYDISSLTFNEIGYYDTSEIDGLYVGNWGTYVYLPSNNIISSDIETGLYILQFGGVTIQHDNIVDQAYSPNLINFTIDAESTTGDLVDVTMFYSFNNNSEWNEGFYGFILMVTILLIFKFQMMELWFLIIFMLSIIKIKNLIIPLVLKILQLYFLLVIFFLYIVKILNFKLMVGRLQVMQLEGFGNLQNLMVLFMVMFQLLLIMMLHF